MRALIRFLKVKWYTFSLRFAIRGKSSDEIADALRVAGYEVTMCGGGKTMCRKGKDPITITVTEINIR
jgi:hypothetical protein